METMKKEWGKPLTSVQEFVPQEYCGACQSASHGLYKHTAHCLSTNVHAYIFYDDNGTPGIQSDENLSLSSGYHGGCNQTHTWYDDSPTVTPNAVIVLTTLVNQYCDPVGGVYKLKDEWVDSADHPVTYYTSSNNTAPNGPTWAIVIDKNHSASHTWIVSPNQGSWKTVVS